MKRQYFSILLLAIAFLFLANCQNNDENNLSDAERKKLLDKYEAEKQTRKEMDSLLILISQALDSVEIGRAELSGLINREAGSSRRDVLAKIAIINRYILQSNEQINELEKKIAQQQNQDAQEIQGLLAVINHIKDELEAKEKEINRLKAQVAELTDQVVNLRGKVQMQESVISQKDEQISQKQQEVASTKQDLETERRNKQMVEIDKLIAIGDGKFAEASKTRLAPEKKHGIYIEAYNAYRDARDLCGNESYFSSKKQEATNKMQKAKNELPKKKQTELE